MIFVFGSNLMGVHGAGAAKFALENHGAIWGKGVGLQGNSYGIPTKDARIMTMRLDAIRPFVEEFIRFAMLRQDLKFQVTRIGCGLAGYTDKDMAPMFVNIPTNCLVDSAWLPFIPNATAW